MTDTNDVAGAPAPEPVLPQDTTPAEPTTPSPSQRLTEAGSDPAPTPTDSDPDARKKTGWQRNKERLDREAREKLELKVANDRLQRERDAIAQELTKLKSPDPTDPGAFPVFGENGLDTVPAYEAATKDWAAKNAKFQAAEQLKAAKAEEQQEQTRRTAEQAQLSINAKMAAAAQTRPDLAQVLTPMAPLIDGHPALNAYLNTSDHAAGVLYDLAKNHPAELYELAQMDPLRAGWRLKDLEARLTTPPPPTPTTKAPPPITPVGAQATLPKTLGDLAAASDASAYIARANATRKPR